MHAKLNVIAKISCYC